MKITFGPIHVTENPDAEAAIILTPTWSGSSPRHEREVVTEVHVEVTAGRPAGTVQIYDGGEIDITMPPFASEDRTREAMHSAAFAEWLAATMAGYTRQWDEGRSRYVVGHDDDLPERDGLDAILEECRWGEVREWYDEIREFAMQHAENESVSLSSLLADADHFPALIAQWDEDAREGDILLLGDGVEALHDLAEEYAP